ncbi:MAG: hypothetical protein NZM26_04430 [Patescibacteria group bacterium]|nr:hypothetical protein [Patescibacteria group bacterium]
MVTFYSAVHAQIRNPVLNNNLQTRNGTSFFEGFISAAILIALVIAVLYFFFNFLQGAIKWIQSGGDKNAIEEAKDRIFKSVIGIVVAFSLWAVIAVLESFLGTNLRSFEWNSLRIF